MPETYTVNLFLPNDLRAAIGDVAAFWSFMEWQVSEIMHALLDLDPKRGRIVSTQMRVRPQVEIIAILVEHDNVAADIAQEFNDAKKEINRLETKRNEIIHGLWARKEGAAQHYLLWYRGNARNRVVGKAQEMTGAQVRAVASQIQNVSWQLDRVLYGVRIGELPPSPDTP